METKITKDQFRSYLSIQHSGLTNMFDLRNVISMSNGNLTKEDCLDIMKNYSTYEKEFNLEVGNE